MGLFLSMSGIMDVSSTSVRDALRAYAESKSFPFEMVGGTTDAGDIGAITREGKNTTILYPAEFLHWDEASQFLSGRLAKPVFSFHIHDGDLWMYTLFNEGREMDWFNPLPEYWQDNLPPEEKEKWRGRAELVARLVPGVSPGAISKYLVTWDLQQTDCPKAYPDDAFALCDCWQVCDFMKKLGLLYPVRDDGTILGDTFRLRDGGLRRRPRPDPVNPVKKPPVKKPWWKFW